MPKRSTAKEVAELAGVSRTTVSFVLNNVPGMRISDETRQRVLQAARDLNYYPDATARRMVSGQTRVIGFVLRQDPDQALADHFLPRVLNGLSKAANEQGYHILFEPIPPKDETGIYMRLINERHVDGIVLSGPRSDDIELLRLHAEGANVVLMGQLPDSHIPSIDVDNVGGAQMAVHYLIGLGHRRIGMITNAPLAYTAATDRLAGYRLALESAGIAYNEDLIRHGNFTIQSGFAAMNELLLGKPFPSAVFVASDTVALGALQAIRQAGMKVPDDISLCGFDDIPLSEFIDPPLTTVRLPAYGLGWGAAELLIRFISNDDLRDSQVILETELVIRDSCGANRIR
ncbi:MAG: LacI family transcriptional regulator [Chloroflexota bacterium]|nr:MAG: LacI family transcriptional regulator [Chloroflexota bacterium]